METYVDEVYSIYFRSTHIERKQPLLSRCLSMMRRTETTKSPKLMARWDRRSTKSVTNQWIYINRSVLYNGKPLKIRKTIRRSEIIMHWKLYGNTFECDDDEDERTQQSLAPAHTHTQRRALRRQRLQCLQWMENPFNLPSMRLDTIVRGLQYWIDIDIVICVFAMLLFS